MRIWKLAGLGMLAFAPLPLCGQVTADIHFGPPQRSWGHEILVHPYALERYGNWRIAYRHWTPVTLYVADGHYYHHRIRGARAVMVYRSHNEYFLPPHEPAWDHFDRRYDYRARPTDEDYNRPRPPH